MNLVKKFYKIKVHYLYIILALFFGVIFVFLTPPFESQDEFPHFLRSYQVSDLKIFAVKEKPDDNYGGNFLPKSINQILETLNIPERYFSKNKVNRDFMERLFSIKLEQEQKVFISSFGSGTYSPVDYVPASIGISIGKFFDLPVLYLLYLGRLFNLIIGVFLVALSIKIIKSGKWVIFAIAMLPTFINQFAAISPDPLTIAFCFLFIALTLNLASTVEKIKRKHLIWLFIIAILIALSKQGYVLITLLFPLVISSSRFQNRKKYLLANFLLIVIPILVTVLWSLTSLPVSSTSSGKSVVQIIIFDIILSPFSYIKYLAIDLYNYGGFYIDNIIAKFHWLDYDTSNFFVRIPLLISLILISLNQSTGFKNISKSFRLKMVGMFIFLSLVSMTLIYIFWVKVLGNTAGFQGRYLIPMLPLLLFAISDKNINFSLKYKRLIYILLIFFTMFFSFIAIIHKYYFQF